MTNFEKIKKMSIDEMSEFFGERGCCECCIYDNNFICTPQNSCCEGGVRKWLESEAE